MQADDLAKRSIERLVRFALACGDEGDRRWEAIRALQDRGSREVIHAAEQLCVSAEPKERCLGADILAQGQSRPKTFHEEAVTALLRMLEREADPAVLSSIAMALGHRRDARAVQPLATLRSHPNPDVRYSVVLGLLTHEDEHAVRALIELSTDEDSDVRDWATFGLGTQVSVDSPALREALVQRLTDPDPDTRAEAIVGLARRQDERAVPALVAAIDAGWEGSLVREAVEALPNPDALKALSRSIGKLSDEARAWAEALLADGR